MGRFIAVVLVVLIGIGVLGFYRDWWQISSASHGGEVDYTLKVDKDKIKQDRDAALERVRKAGDTVREKTAELADRDAVRGKVTAVDAVKGVLTVAPEKAEAVTVQTNDKTVIKRNDETITLREVQIDQPVMVVFATEDGKRVARSITVETK